jgi:hypothetical protein
MKKYSYNLFPKPFIVIAYILIFLSIVYVFVSALIIDNWNHLNLPGPIVLIIIGLIIVSFKSKIIIDIDFHYILKESSMLYLVLSREKVTVPPNCNRIMIKQKVKRGTGYYKFVLPVSYSFKSFDMFLCSDSELVRLINTDYSRSLSIAGFLKYHFNIEYILE